MNRDVLVSVIVPVYNVENYLDECVMSIVHQTYRNLEIILVDDGSTDRSGEMCDGYTDTRIKVVHQENKGQASARNTGLEIKTGELLLFIDSDDVISPVMVETMVECLEQTGSSIVCCDYTRKYGRLQQKKGGIVKVFDQYEAISHMYDDKAYNTYTWNKLFKSQIMENIRFPDGKRMYEEVETVYQALKKSDKVAYVLSALYYYRKRRGSLVNSMDPKHAGYWIKSLNRIMADVKRNSEKTYNDMKCNSAAQCLYFVNAVLRIQKKPPRRLVVKLQKFLKNNPQFITIKTIKIQNRIGLLLFGVSADLYCAIYWMYMKSIRIMDFYQ